MFFQHLPAKWINLHLPNCFYSCSFKPKIKATNAGKQTAMRHLFLIHTFPAFIAFSRNIRLFHITNGKSHNLFGLHTFLPFNYSVNVKLSAISVVQTFYATPAATQG